MTVRLGETDSLSEYPNTAQFLEQNNENDKNKEVSFGRHFGLR